MQESPLAHLIDNLVKTVEIDSAALQQRYMMRQTLRALVRLASMQPASELRGKVSSLATCHTSMLAASEPSVNSDSAA